MNHAFESSHLPEELMPGLGGASKQNGPCRCIRNDASLRANLCTVPDVKMASHCCLAADLDEVSQYRRSRDADLGDNHATAAQSNIMTNLNEVIEP